MCEKEYFLSEKQREWIQALMSALEQIIETLGEPIDTKVLGMLEITHDMLEQQLVMDIYYEWDKEDKGDKEGKVDKINGTGNLPTSEELNEWFKI